MPAPCTPRGIRCRGETVADPQMEDLGEEPENSALTQYSEFRAQRSPGLIFW